MVCDSGSSPSDRPKNLNNDNSQHELSGVRQALESFISTSFQDA